MSEPGIVMGVVGIDHRHIYGMLAGMFDAGATCKAWWTEGQPRTLKGFLKRFDTIPRSADRRAILDDPEIELVLIAAPPHQRADLAIEAMEHGKDVMLDKPGCISASELERIRAVVERTGRIWSIDFSERFEVPATIAALEIVRQGRIGRVIQTLAVGPHRLNRATRPDWFFQRELYGGILADIGTHQIDQFLTFAGAEDARIELAHAGNHGHPDDPGFQDFGELVLSGFSGSGAGVRGYARLDWFTPDALPNWGDGRLTVLGTEGYIELRKYVDVEGRPGTDHLFVVNGERSEYVNCAGIPLTYFRDTARDVRDRTETALSFDHAYRVSRLALQAQRIAEDR